MLWQKRAFILGFFIVVSLSCNYGSDGTSNTAYPRLYTPYLASSFAKALDATRHVWETFERLCRERDQARGLELAYAALGMLDYINWCLKHLDKEPDMLCFDNLLYLYQVMHNVESACEQSRKIHPDERIAHAQEVITLVRQRIMVICTLREKLLN